MASRAIEIEDVKTGEVTEAVYEHPFVVRLCHWVNAVSLFVMVGSGFQIFRAFPSFGAKIPQKDLLNWPKSFALQTSHPQGPGRPPWPVASYDFPGHEPGFGGGFHTAGDPGTHFCRRPRTELPSQFCRPLGAH